LILLMPNHLLGLECVAIIEKNEFNVMHIFSVDKKEQKPKKMTFFMGDSRIKACTIHSFKGWEGRYMVIAITEETNLSLAYVAMSRLKRHVNGSYLTVVCSNPNLRDFGKTWPGFSEHSQILNSSCLGDIPNDSSLTKILDFPKNSDPTNSSEDIPF
jgi:hypothetical protein